MRPAGGIFKGPALPLWNVAGADSVSAHSPFATAPPIPRRRQSLPAPMLPGMLAFGATGGVARVTAGMPAPHLFGYLVR